jgi:hypothetical protein
VVNIITKLTRPDLVLKSICLTSVTEYINMQYIDWAGLAVSPGSGLGLGWLAYFREMQSKISD